MIHQLRSWARAALLALFFLLIGALWSNAYAFICMPKEIGGSGTYYTWSESGTGRAALWVCGTYGDGSPRIAWVTWRVDALPSATCAAALVGAKLAAAADAVPAANQALAACSTSTLGADGHISNPVEDAAFQPARAAVLAAWAADHPNTGPGAVNYWVTSVTAYPLNPDGTRSITPWPSKAILHEPCDCAVKIVQFGATFCRVPTMSTTAQTVVAGCGVVK